MGPISPFPAPPIQPRAAAASAHPFPAIFGNFHPFMRPNNTGQPVACGYLKGKFRVFLGKSPVRYQENDDFISSDKRISIFPDTVFPFFCDKFTNIIPVFLIYPRAYEFFYLYEFFSKTFFGNSLALCEQNKCS